MTFMNDKFKDKITNHFSKEKTIKWLDFRLLLSFIIIAILCLLIIRYEYKIAQEFNFELSYKNYLSQQNNLINNINISLLNISNNITSNDLNKSNSNIIKFPKYLYWLLFIVLFLLLDVIYLIIKKIRRYFNSDYSINDYQEGLNNKVNNILKEEKFQDIINTITKVQDGISRENNKEPTDKNKLL